MDQRSTGFDIEGASWVEYTIDEHRVLGDPYDADFLWVLYLSHEGWRAMMWAMDADAAWFQCPANWFVICA